MSDMLHKFIGHLEPQTNRGWNLYRMAGGQQCSSFGIDPETHDVVGILIGRQQETTTWIERKIARRLSTCGYVFHNG